MQSFARTTLLSGREQMVQVNGKKSTYQRVEIGTPQGSVLSPILFCCFINDLPACCNAGGTTVIYADDTNFLISEGKLNAAVSRSQTAIDQMSEWCTQNGLVLNSKKTNFVQFAPKNMSQNESHLLRIEGQSIEQLPTTKFLGVFVDSKLTWSAHVEYLCGRLSSVCFLFRQLRGTVETAVLLRVYYGIFCSIMSYGILYWGGSSDAYKIFTLQKKVIRIILGLRPMESCKEAFRELRVLTFPSLYLLTLISHTHKSKADFVQRNEIHSYPTRGSNLIHQPFSRLTVGQRSFEYMAIKCYNKLPDTLKQIRSQTSFSTRLKKILVDRCYYSVEEFLEDRLEHAGL